jgi:hypothetical protein
MLINKLDEVLIITQISPFNLFHHFRLAPKNKMCKSISKKILCSYAPKEKIELKIPKEQTN